MKRITTPTPEQLYALEQLAHRERAAAQARLIFAAAQWLKESAKSVLFRPYARRAPRKVAYDV